MFEARRTAVTIAVESVVVEERMLESSGDRARSHERHTRNKFTLPSPT